MSLFLFLFFNLMTLDKKHTFDFVSTSILSFWIMVTGVSYLAAQTLKTFELLTPAVHSQVFSLAPLLLFTFPDSSCLKNANYLFSGICQPLQLLSDSNTSLHYSIFSLFGILFYLLIYLNSVQKQTKKQTNMCTHIHTSRIKF